MRPNKNLPEGFDGRTLVRGDVGLAKIFGVDRSTVYRWRYNGYLEPAIVLQVGAVLVYDVNEAVKAMHPKRILQIKRENTRRYNRFRR